MWCFRCRGQSGSFWDEVSGGSVSAGDSLSHVNLPTEDDLSLWASQLRALMVNSTLNCEQKVRDLILDTRLLIKKNIFLAQVKDVKR